MTSHSTTFRRLATQKATRKATKKWRRMGKYTTRATSTSPLLVLHLNEACRWKLTFCHYYRLPTSAPLCTLALNARRWLFGFFLSKQSVCVLGRRHAYQEVHCVESAKNAPHDLFPIGDWHEHGLNKNTMRLYNVQLTSRFMCLYLVVCAFFRKKKLDGCLCYMDKCLRQLFDNQ